MEINSILKAKKTMHTLGSEMRRGWRSASSISFIISARPGRDWIQGADAPQAAPRIKSAVGGMVLLTLACAGAFQPRAADATEFGVHMDLTYNGDEARRRAAVAAARNVLHASISRNSFPWFLIEPREGAKDWSRIDSVLAELEAAHIAPLFTVYGSPAWASGVSTDSNDWELEVPQDPAAFERWIRAYSDFMREAVRRYRGRVRYWEIGNEPNERFFWRPAPDVKQYARWFSAIHDAIRSEDPGARVAIGGVTGLTASCCIPGKEFLRDLFRDRQLEFDAVAVHPYTSGAPDDRRPYSTSFDDIQEIRDQLTAIGRAVPIWITEWGWSSQTFGEKMQADWIERSLEMIRDRFTFVELATVFLDYDRPPQFKEGLLDENLAPKPAGLRFGRFVRDLMSPIQAR